MACKARGHHVWRNELIYEIVCLTAATNIPHITSGQEIVDGASVPQNDKLLEEQPSKIPHPSDMQTLSLSARVHVDLGLFEREIKNKVGMCAYIHVYV